MSYFHNIEYRHLLREGQYQKWEQANHVNIPWGVLYQTIQDAFIMAGLVVHEFSEAHTAIIAAILGFDTEFLIETYHKEGV